MPAVGEEATPRVISPKATKSPRGACVTLWPTASVMPRSKQRANPAAAPDGHGGTAAMVHGADGAMIRKATRADRQRISEIRFAVRENRPSNPAVIEPLVDWLFDNSTFWVWEEDGAIQGFSAADPRDGAICALFVHPFYEGRGIGRALLPLACDILKTSGHATAVLTTEAGTRAERFYRTDGWTEIGRKEDGQIIFQKSLSDARFLN
jgi:GNAT superfamily N-acetyltransferase